ncbi:MAG: RNA methyltransferase [Pseudomonadota bacterium]
MAGTDRLGRVEAIDGPAFILVEPQLGENVGACCRAMWNFGLTDLRLVAPRDGWPNPAAAAMASGATRVLDAARAYPTVAEAAAEMTTLYASTARPREMTKRVLSPREAAEEMVARMRAGERIGLLFGRERTGLENEDVLRANAIVTVPANPAFASLNLAQCALLMASEIRAAALADAPAPARPPAPEDAPASREAVDRLYAHLEEQLDAANYFWPEHKRAAMAASLRNLLSRAPLTDQDARMLHGVIRALAEKPRAPRR